MYNMGSNNDFQVNSFQGGTDMLTDALMYANPPQQIMQEGQAGGPSEIIVDEMQAMQRQQMPQQQQGGDMSELLNAIMSMFQQR